MPNYCDYELKIKGEKENVMKVVSYLQADYSYENGYSNCTADKHFFRVFEADTAYEQIEDDGLFSVVVYGYCAWSVYCCMFKGVHTYYNDWTEGKKAKLNEPFKGINMEDITKELNLTVEIFSSEPGVGFMEHYLVENGEILVNECVKYYEQENEEGDYEGVGGLEWAYAI